VLHLTRDFPPRINGGLSTAVGEMVAAMAGAVESSVISFDGWRRGAPAREVEADAAVFRAAGPDDVEAARRWGIGRGADLVHVHEPLLYRLGAEIGGPQVLSLHVLAHHQDRLRGLEGPTRSARAQAEAIAGAAAVIAPSSPVAETLRADFPEAADRIVCAPLAIADRDAAREAAAGRAERPSSGALLFCGRFADMSGVDQLPAIAAAIAARRPDAELVIAGGLPDNPRADRRWRARLSRELAGMRARLTGWLEPEALDRERAAAEIALAPARYATFGMAVLEAMLAGLPVVGYHTGGLTELVSDGETGLLVDPGDTAALAAAATALLEKRQRALSLGAAARDRALVHYGWPRRIPLRLDLYRRLVDAHPESG
jgi:glycosyltransferase involved in cell wall biosynthesis